MSCLIFWTALHFGLQLIFHQIDKRKTDALRGVKDYEGRFKDKGTNMTGFL